MTLLGSNNVIHDGNDFSNMTSFGKAALAPHGGAAVADESEGSQTFPTAWLPIRSSLQGGRVDCNNKPQGFSAEARYRPSPGL